jgi:hypothetical protein
VKICFRVNDSAFGSLTEANPLAEFIGKHFRQYPGVVEPRLFPLKKAFAITD